MTLPTSVACPAALAKPGSLGLLYISREDQEQRLPWLGGEASGMKGPGQPKFSRPQGD